MTLNLSLVTDEFAICVTDRRLSAPAGGIVSERGNKLTVFQCRGAHGFITYCGIGRDTNGQSPNDWIADNPLLASLTFDEFLTAIKNIGDSRLSPLAAKGHDTRHTFVVGGFAGGVPVLAMISNFESVGEEGARAVADPALSISFAVANQAAPKPVIVLATGDITINRKHRIAQIAQLLKSAAPPPVLIAKMTKLIRDVAYAANREGSVGTSVNSVVVPQYGTMDIGSNVVGGTTLLEPPNMISPGMMVRDVHIDLGGGDGGSRYSRVHHKALIRERRCPNCGTPVPEGYHQCGKCDVPVSA
jgi:hypothetical protein